MRLSLSVSPMSAQVSDLADKEFDYVVVGGGVSSRSIYFCWTKRMLRELMLKFMKDSWIGSGSSVGRRPLYFCCSPWSRWKQHRWSSPPYATWVSHLYTELKLRNNPCITFADIPAQFSKQFGNPKYDWFYQTTPQVHANGRQHYWPRGKTLGGSSAINFFVRLWC